MKRSYSLPRHRHALIPAPTFLAGLLLVFCAAPAPALAEVATAPWGKDGTKYTTTSKDSTGKSTHDVMKDGNGAVREENLVKEDKSTGVKTTTNTTYTVDKHGISHPDVTTIEKKDAAGNVISKEKQIWDKDGNQQSGTYQPEGKGTEHKYDPDKKTYKDPNATPPSNGGKPPKYPDIGEGDEKPKPKKPSKSKGGGHSKGSSKSSNGGGPDDTDAGQAVEHYWEGLLRDTNFRDRSPDAIDFPAEKQALFPVGKLEVGAGPFFVFGAERKTETIEHHHITHGHTWTFEDNVTIEIVDNGFIKCPVEHVEKEHVRHDFIIDDVTFEHRNVGLFDDNGAGGSIAANYFFHRNFGVQVSNAVVSGNSGANDILMFSLIAREPIIGTCFEKPYGIAPFASVGFGGVFGDRSAANGNIGAGLTLKFQSGFYLEAQTGWNFNDTQNFWSGGLNAGFTIELR